MCAALVPYLDAHIEEERHHDLWLLEDLESVGGGAASWSGPPRPVSPRWWARSTTGSTITTRWRCSATSRCWRAIRDRHDQPHGRPHRVSPSAFRTLREHAELDIAHGDELFAVIDRLPLTEDQATIIGLNAMSSVQLLARALDELVGRSRTPTFAPSLSSAWPRFAGRTLTFEAGAGSARRRGRVGAQS